MTTVTRHKIFRPYVTSVQLALFGSQRREVDAKKLNLKAQFCILPLLNL